MASALKEEEAGSSAVSNETTSSPSQVEQPSSRLTFTSKQEIATPSDVLFSLSSTLQNDLNRALKSLHTGMSIIKEATSRGEFELFRKLPVELRLKVWRYAAWLPQVIAIKDDCSPHHMAISGAAARCPLVRVNKEAREEVLKTKIDFNAQCKVDGFVLPKIWVNLEVDTIWLMNWVRGTIAPSVPMWSKWEKCPVASIKRLAAAKVFVGEFFDIIARYIHVQLGSSRALIELVACFKSYGVKMWGVIDINPSFRTDELCLEELFVLYGAEEGVLDAGMIRLVEPNQNARFAALSLSPVGRDDNSFEGQSFWEKEATLTKNNIQKAHDCVM
ncbi:hypothetical protein IFR05_004064 [Cadophora sp. M221]|nr:hypothetical protein IFR05_004064 [Cadophora sp. M221]